jgi:hypothetical protein
MFLKALDFSNSKTVSDPEWNTIIVTDIDFFIG